MKTFQFIYQTTITFDSKVTNHHFKLRCLPFRCRFQEILVEDYSVSPYDSLMRGTDNLGNELLYGNTLAPHNTFSFASRGVVSLSQYLIVEEPDYLFRLPTKLTEASDEMRDFLHTACPSSTMNIVDKSMCLVEELHKRMKYESFSTNSQTVAKDAFAGGKGVCQDFAQIMLALLRSEGIACRYVAGFIQGEGESHAWIEVNDNGVWYAIDPTHKVLVESDYLKISQGRDFNDCSMERGLFYGDCTQHKFVHISMSEV